MERHPEFAIDIEKLVANKMGGKAPGWLVRLLKRLTHIEYVNDFLVRGYFGEEFCAKCLEYLDVKVEIDGMDNFKLVPDGCHCTIASNHPLGGIDGVALIKILSEQFDGNVRLLANDVLMAIKGIAPMCVPINKFGGQARNLPKLISEAFDSDNEMLTFPAGACSRKFDGKIQDWEWKKTFITQSRRSGRYVVPVHFIAQNSKRFYRFANLTKKLKLKFNLAMLLLPDEMYKGQHQTVRVIIGKPIPPESFDKSKNDYEWAQEVRQIAYNL